MLLCCVLSMATYGQEAVPEHGPSEDNLPSWSLQSFGITAAWGNLHFLTDRTIGTFRDNTSSGNKRLYELEEEELYQVTRNPSEFDPLGPGVFFGIHHLTRPEEIRIGFSFQNYSDDVRYNRVFFKNPDTLVYRSLYYVDEYTMVHLRAEYLRYSKPFLKYLKAFGSAGLEFGYSSTHIHGRRERVIEADTSDVLDFTTTTINIQGPYLTKSTEYGITSKPRYWLGARGTVGLEFFFQKRFWTTVERFGIFGSYGASINYEKTLRGGSTTWLWNDFMQIGLRYYLR